ncbi:hypothetical protein CJ469_05070 [Nocardia farcinica]|uniref:hypothetical protein n=1 Tax=Nocardia farcinica TaxID=37329 RepID=UPI000C01EDA8|nr:hypothetical protein [Nocardia farcinica]PFW99798.1 hypothetical protein CJ469_05070 [Nocardia farcinica]PFX02543.1 hypothetical protein CJ468_05936 [Nocardia farcinica]
MSPLNNQIRPIDHARAARVVLGLLDGELDMLNRSLSDAAADNEVHLLIGALAGGLGELLVQTVGERNARATMHRVIVEAQANGGRAE